MPAPLKKECHLRGGILFLCALFFSLNVSAAGETSLAQLNDLAASGVPQLALHLLVQQQPDWKDDAAGWLRWERQRIQLLASGRNWVALHERTQNLPEGIPVKLERWFSTWRARALIELGQAGAARAELRRLLWRGQAEAAEIMDWRRLIIQSYRAEGLGDDAYAALLRFRQDYGSGRDEDSLLGAQVLLGQERAGDALAALQGLDAVEAKPLRLLAQLRADRAQAASVLLASRTLRGEKEVPEALRQQAAGVMAQAAQEAADPASAAIALEQVFANWQRYPLNHALFPLSPDALWDAYLAYAQAEGNRDQLLIGDDDAWLAKAGEAGRKQPILQRSIYALLALQGGSEAGRQQGHEALLQSLIQQSEGIAVVQQLYLSSRRYPVMGSVPETVRRALLDPAIASGDLPLAGRLMADLDAPSPGIDRVMWRLRQARLRLLNGEYDLAEAILSERVAASAELASPELDRLVQVIFDLQTVGEQARAYRLFAALQGQVADTQRKRELWYWMADARLAQERPIDAAALYLRSAMVPQPISQDPWGQTARYQAAKALAQAGLIEDANTLYNGLLKSTDDPARRAVLQREIQQLWLLRRP